MTDVVAAAAPPTFAVSACFCVATPLNDEQLRRGHAWAAAIVAAVGDATLAQQCTLVSVRGLIRNLYRMGRIVVGNPRTTAVPAALGGLKEHTLVVMTRALDPARPTQGLVLSGRDGATGAVVIDEDVLGALTQTEPNPALTPNIQVTGSKPPSNAEDVALLLNVLVRSVYRAVYLCPLGEGGGIDRVAARLFALTRVPVYYNTAPLVLDGEVSGALRSPPRVGPVGGATATGHRYYSTEDVALVAASTRAFLPGARVRLQGATP